MSTINKPNDFQPNTTIASSEVNDNFDTIYSEFNGNISSTNLADNAVTTAKIADDAVTAAKIADGTITAAQLSSETSKGYYDLGDTPDTVTYNGNRSYDLVFNSNDLTDTVSNGMRVKLTRTVTPPTQCTDLESGSSQYWSKTSPSGISFTDDFTCSAWIKLESYPTAGNVGNIITRRTATTGWALRIKETGQLTILGGNTSNFDVVETYQSIPLNKWVHVAATLDLSGSTSTTYIDGVSVPNSYTNSAATTVTQGGNLEIGSAVGANFFDGKIAQASVHNAILTGDQIRAMASQTISSSSPSIVAGFTFNGVATDVTANANDLTASGGATYGTDSPMNATEYGIITANPFSTNTTLTVQVPEGYSIPTSGGVSAVSYSTQHTPYGFPANRGKWGVQTVIKTSSTRASAVSATYYSGGTANGEWVVAAPIGDMVLEGKLNLSASAGTSTQLILLWAISTSNSAVVDTEMQGWASGFGSASGTNRVDASIYAKSFISNSTQTNYFILAGLNGNTSSMSTGLRGDNGACVLTVTPAYI